jgi:competence protein ComEC
MRCTTLILLTVLCTSCGGIAIPTRQQSTSAYDANNTISEPLKIFAIDVGQGDATLIITPTGESALVDAGPKDTGYSAVSALLGSQQILAPDIIISTHYHEDHIGGIPELVTGPDHIPNTADDIIPKGGFYDRGAPEDYPESPSFPAYESAISGRRHSSYPGQHIRLGDVDIEIVAQNSRIADGVTVDVDVPADENQLSAALLIEYAGFRMLIAGDVTGGGGNPPYVTNDIETPLGKYVGDIDVLRIAHHGSHTSTNADFLDSTAPEAAIISAGNGNDFFHPHPSVIQRLKDRNIDIYQTERGFTPSDVPIVAEGTITVSVDETGSYEIAGEKPLRISVVQ